MKVSEVRVGVLDAADTLIEAVYTKNDPLYAVYRTSQRVMIHLADDVDERKKQQEILALLNPLRNEINALIDGWRTSPEHDKEALTKLYDRRIADALTLALESDPTASKALLKSTLDEIDEERQSRGRIEHLFYAAATSGAIALLILLATWVWDAKTANFLDHDLNALLFAAAIGAIGALVSIGIAVRERQLKTDLQTRDNVADAVLRVTVGAVGALLLIAMMRTDLIDVDFGNVDLANRDEVREATIPSAGSSDGTGSAARSGQTGQTTIPPGPTGAPPATTSAGGAAPPTPPGGGGGTAAGTPTPVTVPVATNGSVAVVPDAAPENATSSPNDEPQTVVPGLRDRTKELLVILVIAFFAGFSERLVKQLAERMRFRDVAAELTQVASPPDRGAAGGRSGPRGGGAGQGGGAPTGPGPAGGGGALSDPGAAEEELVDGCIADVELAEDDLTDDSELPETTGGVAEESRT